MMQAIFAALVAFTAVDGDTVVIDGERIRIANIDTPEIHHAQCDAEQRLGLVAKRRLTELLASGKVEVLRGDPDSGRLKDRYGRTLAILSVDGKDVGGILVEEGLAREWTGRRASWCIRP
ncbi:MAG TPA: thermonuclease family protein [Mesorhizobium sp.]|jgi:endonuclease YncB( thermonuclease family)|uniref:thermonuclease family protein n=1 Tax=Mesorhizobium sp. TaxID=1871066 RepID=UPI002DDD282E|nr:thermonuclease family protein [Mesorhizobium sp.]HEV2501500.1 thermonuclease family protein [Mesorhizobium sp.]